MEQLPLIFQTKKFYRGDKVEILSKSHGWGFEDSLVAQTGIGYVDYKWHSGDDVYVVRTRPPGDFWSGSDGGLFLNTDLRLIERGE